jgi:hypothetical protein
MGSRLTQDLVLLANTQVMVVARVAEAPTRGVGGRSRILGDAGELRIRSRICRPQPMFSAPAFFAARPTDERFQPHYLVRAKFAPDTVACVLA